MSSNITLDPVASLRSEYSAEVEYRLTVEDQVACWVYLACRAPQFLPERVRQRLKDTLAVIQGLLGVLAMAGLSLLAWVVYPPAVGPCAILAFMGGLVLMGFLDAILTGRPGMFLEGSASRVYRWAFLRGLRELASRDERDGTLNTTSSYRLSLSVEGFTRLSEQRETRAGPLTVTTRLAREETAGWEALAFLGCTERNAFLVVRDGTVVILPRRCFADEASFNQFVETVQGRRTVARGTSSSAIKALSPAVAARHVIR